MNFFKYSYFSKKLQYTTEFAQYCEVFEKTRTPTPNQDQYKCMEYIQKICMDAAVVGEYQVIVSETYFKSDLVLEVAKILGLTTFTNDDNKIVLAWYHT